MKTFFASLMLFVTTCTMVPAGEALPLQGAEGPSATVSISSLMACEDSSTIERHLNNYEAERAEMVETGLDPEGCVIVRHSPPRDYVFTPEYRYLDDEGDTTIIVTSEVEGRTFWSATLPERWAQWSRTDPTF